MSIVLVGSTSGSITLQEPAIAGTTVLDLPAVSGTIVTTGSPQSGSVLQVVSTTNSTQASIATTTWTDTGVTATITPKFATSKILVIVNANGNLKSGNNTWAWYRVDLNGSVDKTMGTYNGTSGNSNDNAIGSVSVSYLSTPATTSACVYKLQFAAGNGGNVYINASNSENSGITLMEIAA